MKITLGIIVELARALLGLAAARVLGLTLKPLAFVGNNAAYGEVSVDAF